MTIDLKAAPMTELVKLFNDNCAAKGLKPVKKFADRKTAERRVAEVMGMAESKAKPKAEKAKPAPAAKPAKPKAEKAPRDPDARAVSIARSWTDPAVRAARTERTQVRVGGVQYKSVAEAFRALKLPMAGHIKFRAELKAAKRKVYEGYTFTTVANGQAE